MKMPSGVAITAMGCICSLGNTLAQCAETLFGDRINPAPPSLFRTEHLTPYPVFEVDFTPPQGDYYLRTAALALHSASEAVMSSGWALDDLKGLRVGVCIGTTVGSAMNSEEFYQQLLESGHPSMTAIDRFLRSNPAQAVARELGLSGPCQTIVNACSSGADAIGVGAGWLRSGLCDVVLAGGADELSRVTYNGFISLMITADLPVKPFDANRKGLNLGEGAAMVMLESESLARRRGATLHGFLAGYGSACDAHHLTAPHPEGRGLKQALAVALQQASLNASQISFVNAHGTGTPDNDRVETRVLAEQLPDVPFFSTKGMTGHTLGAAGAIEAALTIACLNRGAIPASCGWSDPDPTFPCHPIAQPREISGEYALSQSLAFGGNNTVVIFRKGEA